MFHIWIQDTTIDDDLLRLTNTVSEIKAKFEDWAECHVAKIGTPERWFEDDEKTLEQEGMERKHVLYAYYHRIGPENRELTKEEREGVRKREGKGKENAYGKSQEVKREVKRKVKRKVKREVKRERSKSEDAEDKVIEMGIRAALGLDDYD